MDKWKNLKNRLKGRIERTEQEKQQLVDLINIQPDIFNRMMVMVEGAKKEEELGAYQKIMATMNEIDKEAS